MGTVISKSPASISKIAISPDTKKIPPLVKSDAIKTQNGNDAFDVSAAGSFGPYDMKTGIVSESPEILLMTDFIPAYYPNGNLTLTGQLMDIKQDALLVTAQESISNILSSPFLSLIQNKIDSNQLEINNFSSKFGQDFQKLLNHMSTIMRRLDPHLPLDPLSIVSAGIEDQNKFGYPLNQNDILGIYSDGSFVFDEESNQNIQLINVGKWSATKTWLQLCLQLKDYLMNGMPDGVIAQKTGPGNTPFSTDVRQLDAYSVFPPLTKSQSINRFRLRSEATYDVDFFSVQLSPTNIQEKVNKLKSFYKGQGIFSKKIDFQDSSNEESYVKIAQILQVLSKESVYSLSTSTGNQIFSQLGYTKKNAKNFEMWDYLIGQTGEDISDINTAPKGNGFSLISLAQSVETDAGKDFGVLTFESQYIDDNIGQRAGGQLTPGLYYYLESSISPTGDNFDISRLNSLLNKLKTASSIVDFIKNLSFRATLPIDPLANKTADQITVDKLNNLIQKRNSQQIEQNNDGTFSTPGYSLTDPIDFLRKITDVIAGSKLLDRKNGPAFLSTDDKSGKYPSKLELDNDFSTVFFNFSKKNEEFKSLLFFIVMLQAAQISAGESTSINTPLFKVSNLSSCMSYLADKALDVMKSNVYYDSSTIKTQSQFNSGEFSDILANDPNRVSQSELKSQLIGDSNKSTILKKLSVLMHDLIIDNAKNSSVFFSPDLTSPPASIYSGMKMTAYFAAIFDLCCHLISLVGPYELTKSLAENVKGDQEGETYYSVAKTKETIAGFKTLTRFRKIDQPSDILDGITTSIVYNYDIVTAEAEKILFSSNEYFCKCVNFFKIFIDTAKSEVESFVNRLNAGEFSTTLLDAQKVIGDPAIARLLMSQKQISLVASKLFDVKQRTASSYSSPVKDVIPYFSNVQSDPNFEKLLPIDDVDLVPWRLFLSKFLRNSNYDNDIGSNKKILSIGLPQGLYRRISSEKNSLSFSNIRNDLIKIKVYMIDVLNPTVVYQSQDFIFNLKIFPTRVLGNYPDAVDILNGKKEFDIMKVPFLIADPSYTNYRLTTGYEDLLDESYNFLSSFEKQFLYNNHVNSLMLEKYTDYLSDIKVDEHRYIRYNLLKSYTQTNYQQFLNSLNLQSTYDSSNPSAENFFINDTLFFENTNEFKKALITPRKFDRVFHVPIDPDNFQVDVLITNAQNQNLQYVDSLVEQGYLINQNGSFFRKPYQNNQISFERYYVLVDPLDEP